MITVSWFSAGVSSAIATKLAINEIDKIIYNHIDDHHPDTMRFVKDCEKWFNKKIEIISSPYHSVENVCLEFGHVNSPNGAICTQKLKRQVRVEWEKNIREPLRYVWGMDVSESDRCKRLEAAMPMIEHLFPLVEHGLTKTLAHKMLNANGIRRPKMYDLGYNNNNCVGCVKGGMGYWNKIRQDFPTVFNARAKMERKIGRSCMARAFLDELSSMQGRKLKPIVEDCGAFCEFMVLD